jgi:DNA-directed RNA polymerase specialized sigma24 family protein
MIEDTYAAVRQKLEFFFRHRGCAGSDIDDLVSESVMRVLSKTQDGVEVREMMAYAFGIAKNILHEYRACPRATDTDLEALAGAAAVPNLDTEDRELRDRCLAQCFQRLSGRNKAVIRDCLQREPPLPTSLRVRKHRVLHTYLIPCCHQCVERGARSVHVGVLTAAKSS